MNTNRLISLFREIEDDPPASDQPQQLDLFSSDEPQYFQALLRHLRERRESTDAPLTVRY